MAQPGFVAAVTHPSAIATPHGHARLQRPALQHPPSTRVSSVIRVQSGVTPCFLLAAAATSRRAARSQGLGLGLGRQRRLQRVTALRAAKDVEEAKAKFLALLKEKGGDCSDEKVLEEVDALSKLNPTKDAATTGSFLDADWRQVSKSTFPGEVREEVYTLGRLSFNLYEPSDMEWKIERTLNPVRPTAAGEGDGAGGEREYEFWIDLTCVDSRYPKFKGIMKNFGMCKPDAKKPERLEVWFTGGSLAPAPDMDPDLLPEWNKTFSAAFGAKQSTLFSKVGDWAMKMMMGLEKPKGVNEDGSMQYEMAKAPHGYTDILFMDDDLRITKGNRGTVVVVDRPPPK